MLDRIVILVDMDCFYCQVEARLNPALKGKPMAVVQYNQWKGGGIIAVNYEARDFGVTRNMRGDEAKKKCPDIELVHVPCLRGKADLTKYRDAGREVVDVLCQFSDCVQRASVDEAYIDVTQSVSVRMKDLSQIQPSQLPTTFVVGFSGSSNNEEERLRGLREWLNGIYGLQDETQMKLAIAGLIVEEMRSAVFKQTGFRCSAGIAHNKILGKLVCGLHKPNRQTILPQSGVPGLYKTLPVKKVRNLGGKFGCMVEEQLGCSVMADLLRFSEHQLQQRFDEKTGTWLYNIARGIDNEPVTPRLLSKSIGCCKKFPGRQALARRADVEYWLGELAAEMAERLGKDLDENKRRAKLLSVSYAQDSSCSRSGPLTSYDPKKIANDAFDLLKKSNSGSHDAWYPPLKFLGISVGKFVDESCNQNSTLLNFFKTSHKIAQTSCNDKHEEGDKTVGSRDGSDEKRDKETGGNTTCIKKQVEDNNGKREQVGEDKKKDESKTSSLKNSFFLRYLKKKAEISAVAPSSADTSDDDMFEDKDETTILNKIKPSDFNSEILANSKIPVTETDSKSEYVTDVNFGASTSRVNDNADELCVSLSEIFPDLDEVDNDVVDLLPSPMQKRLQARIKSRKKHNISNDTRRNLDRRKNIGNHEADTGTVSEMENSSHSGEGVNNHSKQKSFKSQSDENDSRNNDISMETPVIKNGFINEIGPQKMLQEDWNNENIQNALKPRNSELEIAKEGTVMEDPDAIIICEKENSPLVEQKTDSNKQKTLKSINDETGLKKQGIATENFDNTTVSEDENITSKLNNSTESNSASSVVEKCPECGEVVLLSEYLEHLDFHAAERLHKELNLAPQSAPSRKIPAVELPVKRKRGRGGKKTSAIGADKKLRSITAFFAPKQ